MIRQELARLEGRHGNPTPDVAASTGDGGAGGEASTLGAANQYEPEIGSVVWSKARDSHGVAARGGMVVDAGINESTGEPYLMVIAEDHEWTHTTKRRGSQTPGHSYPRPVLLRMYEGDIDPALTVPTNYAQRHGCAKKVLSSCGQCTPWPTATVELARYALALIEVPA